MVQNALGALEEQLTTGNTVGSREGYLTNAIRRRWKPNYERRNRRSSGEEMSLQHPPDRLVSPFLPVSCVPASAAASASASRSAALPPFSPASISSASSPASSPASVSAGEDFSQTITLIQINIRRLGWNREQAEAVLLEKFGKSKQRLLSEQELCDWANFLATHNLATGYPSTTPPPLLL